MMPAFEELQPLINEYARLPKNEKTEIVDGKASQLKEKLARLSSSRIMKTAPTLSTILTGGFGEYAKDVSHFNPNLEYKECPIEDTGGKVISVKFRLRRIDGKTPDETDFELSNYDQTFEAFKKFKTLLDRTHDLLGLMQILLKERQQNTDKLEKIMDDPHGYGTLLTDTNGLLNIVDLIREKQL